MPALKPSEKRLLMALGGAFFLVANFWAWSFLQGRDQKAGVEEVQLRRDIQRMQKLQAQLPVTEKHDKILATYLKRYDSMNMRETYLLNFIQEEVDRLNLKIAKNAPTKTEGLDDAEADFIKSGYSAEVSGDQKSVLMFVHGLHNPAEFRFVKTVNISVRKSEQQDGYSELVCNFEIQKFWHPDSERLMRESETNKSEPPLANTPPKETERGGANDVRPNGDAAPSGSMKVDPPPADGSSPATVPANDQKPTVQ